MVLAHQITILRDSLRKETFILVGYTIKRGSDTAVPDPFSHEKL